MHLSAEPLMANRPEKTHPNRAAFPAGLSGPALRALHSAGIGSMRELTRWREAELLALHGMGARGVQVLREALLAENRQFKE